MFTELWDWFVIEGTYDFSFYFIVIAFSILLVGRRLIWLGLKSVFVNAFQVSSTGR